MTYGVSLFELIVLNQRGEFTDQRMYSPLVEGDMERLELSDAYELTKHLTSVQSYAEAGSNVKSCVPSVQSIGLSSALRHYLARIRIYSVGSISPLKIL